MDFKAPDVRDETFLYEEVSTCNRVMIAVMPVLFGFRVVSGFYQESYFELDYCAGKEQQDIELIFGIVKNVLKRQEFSYEIFDGFPKQQAKPYMLDSANWPKFLALVNGVPLGRITLPAMAPLKKARFDKQGISQMLGL